MKGGGRFGLLPWRKHVGTHRPAFVGKALDQRRLVVLRHVLVGDEKTAARRQARFLQQPWNEGEGLEVDGVTSLVEVDINGHG
jgi:hypothetical protein